MKISSLKSTALALAAAFGVCASPAALAAPAWITLGEEAYLLLLKTAPEARLLSSRRVPVTVPELHGSRTLVAGAENVMAVEVDDSVLDALSTKVHEQLHRCGGYAQHQSLAEALAVLHQLETAPVPERAPSYAIDNQAQVNAMLPQVQASNILATIQSLSDFQNRRHNSSHGALASTWLFNAWSQLNPGNRRDVKVRQITHPSSVTPQKSVELEILGSGNSGETIVLGAHLDSISSGAVETARSPGADDDASGVAGLTELIRVVMSNGYAPKRNIRFIAYAAEEVGLRGSQDIASGQLQRRDQLVGVLQLDMTAFQGNPGTDIWIYTDYTNAGQNQFLADLVAAYLPTLTVGYDACGYGCSDHASWHNRGYIASFPHEASNTRYNMAIHTPNDTIATFGGQADHALKFTQLALAYLVELGSDGTPSRPVEAAALAETGKVQARTRSGAR
ncbi:MAG: M20/M25/M40 family metallo-hydrolase [Chitinophagaceae bacterium]|nr:M20/M25/M40 family metallo-hydrolase [Rubrivivax sp.]